ILETQQDQELLLLAHQEKDTILSEKKTTLDQLKILLLPQDPFDKKNYVNKIVSYVSKYVSKNDKLIETNSNKGIDFYSRHLFGFSRT
ncbi:hypothetical protein ACMUE1_00375, partial [Candidatus Phytoplasma asteris]